MSSKLEQCLMTGIADDYANEKANSTCLRCRSADEDGYACKGCIERAIKSAYTQGAADQKQAAVAALDNLTKHHLGPVTFIVEDDAFKAVQDSQPESDRDKGDNANG